MGLEMIDAGWLSILPPLVAITLALLTKEVYSALFLGVAACFRRLHTFFR